MVWGEAGVLRPEGSPSPQIIKTASNPSSGPKAWLGVTLEPESTEEVGGTTLNGARSEVWSRTAPRIGGDPESRSDPQPGWSGSDFHPGSGQVGEHVPDTWVQLEVLRRGERRTLQVKLENPPSTHSATARSSGDGWGSFRSTFPNS